MTVTALANRDDVTYDGEIVEAAPRAPMTLFGTGDPKAVVERASAVATALAAVIDERRLYAQIGQKKHVQVEGWTLLGSMLGVFAEIQWSRPLDTGWEARAVARTLDGRIVGAAEAMCLSNEAKWRSADSHALRSMAQTRSVSKALRLPLGFIMHLAGYSATPAEELADEQPEQRRGAQASSPNAAARVQRTPEEQQLRNRVLELAVARFGHGVDAAMKRLADEAGVPAGERATVEQLHQIIAAIQQPGESAPAPADSDADPGASIPPGAATPTASDSPPVTAPSAAPSFDDILAVSGGEEVPPKPRTDEYRALPPLERAAARAYWDKRPQDEQESLAMALGAPES